MLWHVLTTLQKSCPAIWRQRTSRHHRPPAVSTRHQLRLLLFLLGFVFLGFLTGVPDDGHRAVHDQMTELGVEVTLINGLVQMYSATVATAR